MTTQQTYRLIVYFPNMTSQRKQQLLVPHWGKNNKQKLTCSSTNVTMTHSPSWLLLFLDFPYLLDVTGGDPQLQCCSHKPLLHPETKIFFKHPDNANWIINYMEKNSWQLQDVKKFNCKTLVTTLGCHWHPRKDANQQHPESWSRLF